MSYDYFSNVAAGEAARVNLINNGGFTAYPDGIRVVQNTITGQNEVLDLRKYEHLRFSFNSESAAGQPSTLGDWDVYGSEATLTVCPADSNGDLLPSYDGGNLLQLALSESGSVTLSQPVQHVAGLRGGFATMAYGGRAISGGATVTMQLLDQDGTVLGEHVTSSAAFGRYRRMSALVEIPETTQSVSIQITVSGGAGTHIGISGVAVYQDRAGAPAGFSSSVADETLPSNTVFMFEGDACPSGYREISPDKELLLLVTSGYSTVGPAADYAPTGGSDDHDHSPATPTGTYGSVSEALHDIPQTVPPSSLSQSNVPLFDDIESIETGNTVPAEKTVLAVGKDHSHRMRSNMTAVPPSFPMRFCERI
jgi:hypothetical protein